MIAGTKAKSQLKGRIQKVNRGVSRVSGLSACDEARVLAHDGRMIVGTIQNRETKAKLTQTRAARLLGVTVWHLNRVLRGHRESKSLTKRFRELEREFSTG